VREKERKKERKKEKKDRKKVVGGSYILYINFLLYFSVVYFVHNFSPFFHRSANFSICVPCIPQSSLLNLIFRMCSIYLDLSNRPVNPMYDFWPSKLFLFTYIPVCSHSLVV
jgi:hypothetical protein